MKTKEELNTQKAELEALNAKLRELSDDELEQVAGGRYISPVKLKEREEEIAMNG